MNPFTRCDQDIARLENIRARFAKLAAMTPDMCDAFQASFDRVEGNADISGGLYDLELLLTQYNA